MTEKVPCLPKTYSKIIESEKAVILLDIYFLTREIEESQLPQKSNSKTTEMKNTLEVVKLNA